MANVTWSSSDYIVNPKLEKSVYYKSTYRTLFGKLNGPKEVKTTKLMYDGMELTIDEGTDSPVWEKTFTSGNECRFTTEEEFKGMATYGPADVKPGPFTEYMHSVCYVRQVDSPTAPLVDSESVEMVKDVIPNLLERKKKSVTLWRSKEVDIDAFRSIFTGASRGILTTEDGGLGISLEGGSAGQERAPYNNFVEGQSALTTPSVTLATHNSNLATDLATLSDNSAYAFTYATHERNSTLIEDLDAKPVKIGRQEYRAVAIIDRRNVHRMMAVNGTLRSLFQDAMTRGAKNPALYGMQSLVLDDILYIPARQIEFFRPSVSGSTITWGAGHNKDPRSKSFTNASNICPTVYMGAGALLRGRRKKVWFTTSAGKHEKGLEYCAHYHDGWKRHDKITKDGRSEMDNDSMLVTYNYDPGIGVAYAA